jgi:hypothetical protein
MERREGKCRVPSGRTILPLPRQSTGAVVSVAMKTKIKASGRDERWL